MKKWVEPKMAAVFALAITCFVINPAPHAAGATYGIAYPPAAAAFEGVWQIDLKASGLPGDTGDMPQLTAWGAAAAERNRRAQAAGDYSFDLTAHCSNPGVPRIMSLPNPWELFARADDVTITFEWNHLLRQIHVDQLSHAVPYPMAAGVSTGRWDAGRLRVHTIGRDSKTLLNDVIPNSEELTVDEVFTIADNGATIRYEVTMVDPKVLAKPWTRRYVFRKQSRREIRDDSCLDRLAPGSRAVPDGF
jgi:hypothetical protein